MKSLYPLRLSLSQKKIEERKPPAEGLVECYSGWYFADLNFLDGVALLIFTLVCANIRNCTRPASVIRGLDLLLAIAQYLTDETKLDRLLPFVVALMQNDAAVVRAASMRTLTQTVS